MSVGVGKDESLLGFAPVYIDHQDVLPYFVYCFEFSWIYPMFKEKNKNMMAYFEERFKEEKKDFGSLSLEQKWWLCVLIAMYDIAKYYRYEYAAYVINQFIIRFERINENLLAYYCNFLQSILVDSLPEVLVIRPAELHKLGSTLPDEEPTLAFLIKNQERVLASFKKYLKLDKEYLDGVLINDRRILRKFSNLWNAYYETFIYFFISIYNDQIVPQKQKMEKEKIKQAIQELILTFLTASVSSKDKIEYVLKEIMPLFEPLIEENHVSLGE